MSDSEHGTDRTAEQLAARIAERFDGVYASLEAANTQCRELIEARFGDGMLGPFTPADRAAMRGWFTAVLEAHPSIDGAGSVFAADRIAVADQKLQWYQRTADGYAFHRFNNDERSAQFYDFDQLPWYAEPRATGGQAFAGPYVDFLGVDEYIITLSTALASGGRFAGVSAVDIEVRAVERVFHELARGTGLDAALASLDGRVVCGTSSRRLPGDHLEAAPDDVTYPLPTAVPTMKLVARRR